MKKLLYWGTPEFAVPALEALVTDGFVTGVVTRPDSVKGRGQKSESIPPVKVVAEQHNLSVLQPQKLDTEFISELKKYLPATFLIVAYGKIIPQNILDLSELTPINIHPSLLPDLRGPSPIQTALLRGYEQTGITLMQLDAEMDHGPILAQKKITVVPTDTYSTLSEKLSHASAQFVSRYVPKYLAGELTPKEQDHQRATFCKMISSEDGELNFEDVHETINIIRALNPWPGAYITIDDNRVKILRAHKSAEKLGHKVIGKSKQNKLLIGAKNGTIEVDQIQKAGKSPMSSIDFLNGHADIIGRTIS